MQTKQSPTQFKPRINNLDTVYYLDDQGAIIWLIVGSQKALVIDTGYGNLDLIPKIRQITNKPILLANSHVHHDHIKGDHQFEAVHVHEKDIFLFEKTKKRLGDQFKLPKKIIPIQEGHIFDLGDIQIEVIHLPGHTPGSIGFLYPQAKALFSGDAIMTQSWTHLGHSPSLEVFERSMQKVIARQSDYDTIYISHGPQGLAATVALPKKLAHIARQVIDGTLTGTPTKDFYGQPAHKIVQDEITFLYNPNRLTGERK